VPNSSLDKLKEELAFDVSKDGFNMKVWYLKDCAELNIRGESLVKLYHNGRLIRQFLYPSYKIYNLCAHFDDIVESELANSIDGYIIAGSTGLGGYVLPKGVPSNDED